MGHAVHEDDVHNLAGVSVMVTVCYLLMLLFVYKYNQKYPPVACDEYTHSGRSILSKRYVDWGNTTHRVLRGLMLLYWLGLGWIAKWIRDAPHPRFYMFTVWNIILMVTYFLAASICSWQYSIDPNNEDKSFPVWWPKSRRDWTAHLVRVLHSVVGGCALFVTITAWQGHGGFWGIQQHLMNTCLFLVEGFQTPYVPRVSHFRWTATFLYVYVCFVWIIVEAMKEYSWPYPFMQTYTTPVNAYLSYFAVLVLNAASFALWKYLGAAKTRYLVWVRGSATDLLDVPEEKAFDRYTPGDTSDLVEEQEIEMVAVPRNVSLNDV